MTTTERKNWEAFQLRTAILLGLAVYNRRTDALREFDAAGRKPSQKEADVFALECAAYAESALLRIRSVAGARASLDAMVKVFDAFIAAEAAAGRLVRLGYRNERGNWTILAPADFLRELVAAYRRRGEIRRARLALEQ